MITSSTDITKHMEILFWSLAQLIHFYLGHVNVEVLNMLRDEAGIYLSVGISILE